MMLSAESSQRLVVPSPWMIPSTSKSFLKSIGDVTFAIWLGRSHCVTTACSWAPGLPPVYTSGWVPAALPAAFGKPWSMWSVCPLIAEIAASLYGPPESSKSPPFACAFAVAYATSASRRFLTFSESGCRGECGM